jgi:tetratricopeptide (TPR) repeat protein
MKKIILFAVVLTLPLIAGQIAPEFLPGISAMAAEQSSKKKTRKVPAMRERTYKKLAEAQVMIDPESAPREEGEPPPEPTGTPRDAVDLLMKMRETKGLNSYELAQIWNTLAFAYYTLEDIPNTIRSYENILQQGTITEALELSSLRALFQLYYAEEQYQKSIQYIDRWQQLKETPDAQVTFIKATAYYQLNDFRNSLKFALAVEDIAVAQQKTVKEQWWYLQVVLYNEMNDVDNVIRVLENLIVHYPKKQYWMHLAGMYAEKDMEDQSLSAYYAAYIQGFFQKETEVVMLAQRLLGSANPYEASQVLEKGLKDGLVEENEKNIRLLATAYTMAQETNLAIDAWRDSTKYAEDGELHYRLAQALAAEDRHKEAVSAYRDAIRKGKTKKPGDVVFWKGISEMQLERWDDATKSFRDAARLDKKKAKQTRQYIRYIAGEKRRQEELRKMLEGVGEE